MAHTSDWTYRVGHELSGESLAMAVRIDPLQNFELLLHGVQAVRRRVERLACPIQGASGVRAQFYPHQIQNVQRILCASRVRHLIADEVGMGKTIQALMVANAIRLQVGRLRVRVIVGRSELQSQWVEEIACRAHVTAEMEREVVGHDWFHVVRDSSIQSLADTLAPGEFDLLILDEPQELRAELLGHIAEHSSEYTHVLLLTASPDLRNVRRLCELLQMLEPERIERVRRELYADAGHADDRWSLSPLRNADTETLHQVHERFMSDSLGSDSDGQHALAAPEGVSPMYGQFSEYRKSRFLADARWNYRNVLRSYRADFPDHLPRRILKSLRVEPTTAERQRMELAVDYVHGFLERYHEPDHRNRAADLLRRCSLGGESLQARMRELRRGESEHEPRLVQISELSRKESADARLDALVDWLSDYWRHDPRRKVVVAAQDNPTVDELTEELSWRLPEVGRRGKRVPLQIVSARDERDAVDQTALDASANSQLREFEDEEAQLLVAHDSFQQSYNLQAAEALVFYSLPWTPESLDQWIGRVDRLGRDFVNPEKRHSPPKAVRIVTLHRIGDPTEQIEEVFHRYRVFESALDPDRSLLHTISDDVHASGLGWKPPEAAPSANDSSVSSADEQQNTASETAPPIGSLWTVERAVTLFDEMLDRPIPEPQLRQTKPLGYASCKEEGALASWVSLLGRHRIVGFRRFGGETQEDGSPSRTFFTLSQGHRATPRIGSLEDRRLGFPPFFISRRNIQRPPRLKVDTQLDDDPESNTATLQFLSHGSPLHEEFVDTFMNAGRCETPLGVTVYSLGQGCYPNGTELCAGTYLVGVGFVDSAHKYANIEPATLLLENTLEDEGVRVSEMRDMEVAKFRAGLEADARLVRVIATTLSSCLAWRITDDQKLAPCDARQAADLLSPHWKRDARPNTESLKVPLGYVQQLPALCSRHIASNAKKHWALSLGQIRERIEERVELIRVETEDALWNLRSSKEETLKRIEALELASSEHNEQTIQLTYRPRLALLEEQIALIQRGCDLRCGVLRETLEHLCSPSDESVYLQATAVIQLLPEPELTNQQAAEPSTESNGDE